MRFCAVFGGLVEVGVVVEGLEVGAHGGRFEVEGWGQGFLLTVTWGVFAWAHLGCLV